MTTHLTLTNATLVLPDRVVPNGTVRVEDGTIKDISYGGSAVPGAIDCEGDYVTPGLVELHTDNLEKHLSPRPGVRWPASSGVLAHDSQLASAGITTSFDALTVGDSQPDGLRTKILGESIETITALQEGGHTRAEHFIHLRCEISTPNVATLFAELAVHPLLKLVSVMDHTPGQRQWVDLEKYRARNSALLRLDEKGLDELINRRLSDQQKYSDLNRSAIVQVARSRGLPIASHDDTSVEHVEEAKAAGISISEFPTTLVAAEAARKQRMAIVMGAPNVIRGGSHSGNVAALELVERGLLDILSSDYVPSSLLHAAFVLQDKADITLNHAFDMVAGAPAVSVGLVDRGAIAVGKRADLLWVKRLDDGPLVRMVWRAGRRVS
ncbi:MAG: alpha-D-ribose 1-methylphosphonate 5-triphosphate diphosphatase [Rhodospirillales bacterium]|nr:MAG: alpha-D-ribose 1-methylphosphonate 5-triphosphate diphosphatase [Rhodospirillales bacterium]